MASKPKNGGRLLPPMTVPADLMQRLNRVLARYVAVRPRMYPTRSALIRELLIRGLDAIEPDLVREEGRAQRLLAGTRSLLNSTQRMPR